MKPKPIIKIFRPPYTDIRAIAKATGYAPQTIYGIHLREDGYPYEIRMYLRKVIRRLINDLEVAYKELERDSR